MMSLPAPPITGRPFVASLLQTRRAASLGMFTRATRPTTVCMTFALEGDADLLRLVYENDSPEPCLIARAVFAMVGEENASSGHVPADSAGSPVAWRAVTFANGGTDAPPPVVTAGDVGHVVLPGIRGSQLKSYTFSDWIRVPTVPPTRGGEMRYVQVRTLFEGPGRIMWAAGDRAAWVAASRGRAAHGFVCNGDATRGAEPVVPAGADLFIAPAAIQYYGRVPGSTVLAVGDSIVSGYMTSGNLNGWAHQACAALSSATFPVILCNSGWAGQASPEFYLRGLADIEAFRPQVVTINVMSTNDGLLTAPMLDIAWSRAMDLAQFALMRGAVPVLVGPTPYNLLPPDAERHRLSIVARLNSVVEAGSLLGVDMDTAVATGDPPAQRHWRPEFDCGDGLHPNDAGAAAMARAIVPVLKRALVLG